MAQYDAINTGKLRSVCQVIQYPSSYARINVEIRFFFAKIWGWVMLKVDEKT